MMLIPRHISRKRDTKLASLSALLVPSLPMSSHPVYRHRASGTGLQISSQRNPSQWLWLIVPCRRGLDHVTLCRFQ